MNFFRNKDVRFILLAYILVALIMSAIGFYVNCITGLLIIVTVAILTVIVMYVDKRRYEKISKLTETVDLILHSDEFVVLLDNEEGEFAILESEIRKMTVRIREGAYLLQKEKIYLTDSIADISHQLRTPLTTINLLMSFLQKRELSDEDRIKYVAEINAHLKRIDWLISSLLKISKIDAGTAIMKKERVPVAKVIAKAAESIMIPLEIREQLFDYISMGNETFKGDLNWTVEAISNIIKNCMEHTPNGGHISVEARENTLYTSIEISDTGSGINTEDLPHIFERFYRGKGSADSSVGIGLALSRMIIQNQNGSIKVQNRKEGGSKFTIKFYKGEIDGSIKNGEIK